MSAASHDGGAASPRPTSGQGRAAAARGGATPAEGAAGMAPVDVLVVDDHEVVHWGLRALLGGQPWVRRTLGARDGEGAVALARKHAPHVALVDLFLGRQSGAEVCEKVRTASPRTRVLLVSGAGSISASAARAAGASGFVGKDRPATETLRAVQVVALGGTVFDGPAPPAPPADLTPRERQIVVLLADGRTNPEIARELHLSPHTIKEHVSSLLRKLDARNRAEAARRASALGLL